MTDETGNIVLEQLRHMRARLDTIGDDVATLKTDVATLRLDAAATKIDLSEIKLRLRSLEIAALRPDPNWIVSVEAMMLYEQKMDHLTQRVDRLEQRGAPA